MIRFTIRDVLWLMVVVALGVALWLQTAKLNEMRRELEPLRNDFGFAARAIDRYEKELDRVDPNRHRLRNPLDGQYDDPAPFPMEIERQIKTELLRQQKASEAEREWARAEQARRKPQSVRTHPEP